MYRYFTYNKLILGIYDWDGENRFICDIQKAVELCVVFFIILNFPNIDQQSVFDNLARQTQHHIESGYTIILPLIITPYFLLFLVHNIHIYLFTLQLLFQMSLQFYHPFLKTILLTQNITKNQSLSHLHYYLEHQIMLLYLFLQLILKLS